MASLIRPVITSSSDVVVSTHYREDQYEYHSFEYLTPDDEPWYGTITKKNFTDTPTLDEINRLLDHVEEANVYPEKPASITVAASDLQNVHIKRPRWKSHNELIPDLWAKILLDEALIMEQIPPHPNIIAYYGCRVYRGRITGIVLERLGRTLYQSPNVSDIPAFLAELQSAVDHIHSLGLAHNDINPHNIMIKDGHPILIDFNACGPPGYILTLCGTPGWFEEQFGKSEMKHDTYAMNKMRTWLENGGKEEE